MSYRLKPMRTNFTQWQKLRLQNTQNRAKRHQEMTDRARKRVELSNAAFEQTTRQPQSAEQIGVSTIRRNQAYNQYAFDQDIASSLIWRIRYNDQTEELDIWFNSGAQYRYFEVPYDIVERVVSGNGTVSTNGHNVWGRWFKGKNPSVGKAFIEYIKKGGYRYMKIAQIMPRATII